MSGIGTENTADAGGGLNVGWQDNNDWMDYVVNASAAGTYTVNFRVASLFTGATFQLRKSDGTVLTTVPEASVPFEAVPEVISHQLIFQPPLAAEVKILSVC